MGEWWCWLHFPCLILVLEVSHSSCMHGSWFHPPSETQTSHHSWLFPTASYPYINTSGFPSNVFQVTGDSYPSFWVGIYCVNICHKLPDRHGQVSLLKIIPLQLDFKLSLVCLNTLAASACLQLSFVLLYLPVSSRRTRRLPWEFGSLMDLRGVSFQSVQLVCMSERNKPVDCVFKSHELKTT